MYILKFTINQKAGFKMKIIRNYFNILFVIVFFACSSQEYTTAKLAIQQSDFKKAAEWLPKAMAVEPDNPEIPVVMAVEVHAEKGKWIEMVNLFNKAMDINPEKVIEVRGAFIPVKDAVANYVEFYWAKEFNSGVEQFKKIQNEPWLSLNFQGFFQNLQILQSWSYFSFNGQSKD